MADAAAAVGRRLREHFRQAMSVTLAARGEGKTPEDLVAAEEEAIALLDPEITRAEGGFAELGLESPPADPAGTADDPAV